MFCPKSRVLFERGSDPLCVSVISRLFFAKSHLIEKREEEEKRRFLFVQCARKLCEFSKRGEKKRGWGHPVSVEMH